MDFAIFYAAVTKAATTLDYAYDTNGNMITDANKKISSIVYNYLNLPQSITVTGKGTITYVYDAAGNKLQKVMLEGANTTVTTYLGNSVYQNDTLQFFGTAEGRVRPNAADTAFVYDYFLKDHLGNTRMVLTDDYNVASPILEATSYYPFGLQMSGISLEAATPAQQNKYLYNGKELQNKEFTDGSGLELYDYGARMYDQQIGRFNTQDRFSEKYFLLSPYQYAANNPIRYMDAHGDSIIDKDNIVADLKTYLNNSITSLNAMVKAGTLPQGVTEDMVNGLVGEYQTTLNEIGTLEKSDQIYNVSYNGSADEGGTSYDNKTGQIDIGVAKGSNSLQSAGLAGHELKHGYQYEKGQVSFAVDGKSYGKLYDLSDEKAAYNRQAYLEHGVFYQQNLIDNKGVLTRGATMTPPAYQGLPSEPIDINSKAGKALREQTINAGKAGTPVTEVYKGWQADYKKGQ